MGRASRRKKERKFKSEIQVSEDTYKGIYHVLSVAYDRAFDLPEDLDGDPVDFERNKFLGFATMCIAHGSYSMIDDYDDIEFIVEEG